eukprot:8329094-Pyramimonas_sp.AAC.1
MGGGAACKPCHWNLRLTSLWGREPCEGCADMGSGAACKPCRWSLRWSSLWGHEPRDGVCQNMRLRRVQSLSLEPS